MQNNHPSKQFQWRRSWFWFFGTPIRNKKINAQQKSDFHLFELQKTTSWTPEDILKSHLMIVVFHMSSE